MLHRVGVRVPMPAPRRRGRHIVRGDFFTKVTSHSFCRGSFPNRTRCRWAPVWVRRCAAVFSYRKEISILTAPSTSEQSPLCSDVFLCLRQKRRHPPAPLLLLSNCDPLRWARSWCAALRATSQYQRFLTNLPVVKKEKFTIFAGKALSYPRQFDYLTGGFPL